ncbi:hypothetical protein RHMOL_Rhmol01G0116600 [Rhododendron molle]|uniref:Uncharacterized protein n=2 Tax=Rhododendron molle TaxID=49168 RepID=A0ACC0L9H2_RHOML|nr:hypothetical protein RHMOL_Rhmol13G0225100 [Rhododendron molle]KAI8571395.1 hypothetical protein RHMOL_Rhmol01G0116600 [Rhododendron molle]
MKAHRTNNTNSTEERSITGWRCGKWVLRSTKVRKSRGKMLSLFLYWNFMEGKGTTVVVTKSKLDPPTPISKRKRAAPSPTSSATSVIGENSIEVVKEFDTVLEGFR